MRPFGHVSKANPDEDYASDDTTRTDEELEAHCHRATIQIPAGRTSHLATYRAAYELGRADAANLVRKLRSYLASAEEYLEHERRARVEAETLYIEERRARDEVGRWYQDSVYKIRHLEAMVASITNDPESEALRRRPDQESK